ncbi:endonuclease/exonuclease/phosphatase (EEP) superfamily protein YafD [Actinocorallia herbida]|uniref:Endonuclease/exonuclease/phosphatase (EEP) superfamily protein YafD n=1 Tax=Actinocorallia herbida TaxID=58109 RepID=A0A3N1D4B7_9ACTN|nr:endonuclease/exonuclease/phosphatase family protein [Actinocorallia herbida]ROO88374.1 endonuclease/exonuclease/phosphatase (EEP) superfamily protein YafD [Actinocorallia herbida]
MGRWKTVVAWVIVAPFALWAAVRLSGWDATFRWVQLVSFTPYVAAASVVVPVIALVLRRRAPAVAGAAVVAVFAALLAPRVVPDGEPRAEGPELRVLAANLLFGRTPAADVLRLVRTLDVDVLALSELPSPAKDTLEKAGIGEYLPYSQDGTNETTLYSAYPLKVPGPSPAGAVRAQVEVPGAGGIVEVVAVHTCAPLYPGLDQCWRDSQAALPAATPDGAVRVLAGDFNATLDHATLRAVLATGYRDAAEVRGAALRSTWPADGRPLPGVAIDHVFADRRVAVLGYSVHTLPDSDHRGVFALLRLP